MTPKLLPIALALLIAAAACGGNDSGGNSGQPEGVVTFSNRLDEEVTLNVEFAVTRDEQSTGLMNRDSLPEDQGMLFAFPRDVQAGFFMRSTFIPLSIAFLDASGVIIDIQDMEPETEDLHRPEDASYRYAIEANQGWFEENFISAGTAAQLPTETIEDLLAQAHGTPTPLQ